MTLSLACACRFAGGLLRSLALAAGLGLASGSASHAGAAPVNIATAATIDARKAQMTSRDRMVDGFSAEGTRVTAWSRRGWIEKIEVVALGERGRVLLDFYWQDRRLALVRERRIDYGDSITALPADAPTPLNVISDDSISYSNGVLSGWTLDGRAQPIKDRAAVERSRELSAKARTFLRLMSSPAPVTGEHCDWRCTDTWGAECPRFRCVQD